MNKPELLAPAGDLEKLKMAIIYGADAVYIGGEEFGLRKASKNFTLEDIEKGIEFAHDRDRKVYVTLNIIPHNEDLVGLDEYVLELEKIGVDGVIVADPGVFSVIRRVAPNMPIHLSTQASATNYETIKFWYDLGIRRIVVARELSLEEIKEIKESLPEDLEIEAFVHGAMCISYSGRCLLSNYMVGRDANRGECAHPCRWKYSLMEEKRPGEYFPIYENEKGTFIFNSKDLCMIENIPELIEAGVCSFKIEGRVKSQYYVATVIRSYRKAIDEYFRLKEDYVYKEEWLEEIKKASYRDFTTGFYFKKPTGEDQVYGSSSYIREYDFVGLVLDYDEKTEIATIEQRNRMFVGDEIEVFGPNKEFFVQKIEDMWNENGEEIDVAPHPQQIIKMKMKKPVENWDIIRRARKD
ncbi:U32 family peptidase [Anaerosalibacter bizertensis]|uniref:U32 family peptidase n=1 Tax=Anaerosalibacter bizertensis TaxID=932217 RepID=A0A844FFV3_9FIRM|nr:U32 family peptidase [Anaerosalibacter bizertensis]MBV1818175.1 U32 family peptidase [Bacteroidales bacterium MSK.15.36]HHV26098.1 U32 family peptidase [Tissierellia bacterium]MCB5558439.1 U32 family peptidase [Anaerosalibacter bizertensis]MCG4564203.1 U32 family peptidase [Anaerosalibacter bizertensis]MCG4582124.1 U32 family peptidase [Anaerosalibacter bizertensis]